ncbi:hypothetical protein KM043_013297 [Ampulex compressa]|nr:hypothetical protein KM043_013297 [Ampulex compressa]
MSKILNILRTVRNNWKKSTVGVAALSCGISYSKDIYNTDQLMRQYCEDVVKYGDAPCPTNVKHRHITVILNPAARRRKAKKLFEKYCEPLLHLAGIAVTIIQTESGNHTRNIVANLETPTDAIIVAGGDGTLSDVVTGLMRKYESNRRRVQECIIGILPLGSTNNVANSFYQKYDEYPDIQRMVEGTMAVIENNFTNMDVIEIEPIEQDLEDPIKPIYAVGTIEWGAWKDARTIVDKYWYWGALRKYVTYIFNGYKQNLNWKCDAVIRYTSPCSGCSRCYKDMTLNQIQERNRRWWHAFTSKRTTLPSEKVIDYSKILNENCGIYHELPISTTELSIKTDTIAKTEGHTAPSLNIFMGPEHTSYFSFVNDGWQQENGDGTLIAPVADAKYIELYPKNVDKGRMFYIDNEEYELRDIRVKLLPKSIKMFYTKPDM